MSLELVCLDLDGTLVGASGAPTTGVWEAAERARWAGLHLAICTARMGSGSSWEWAIRLDPGGWHQFQTGASLMHTGTGETSSSPLPSGAAETCAAVAAEHGFVFECYADRDYIVDSDDVVARLHADLLGIPYARRSLTDLVGTPLRTQFIVPDALLDLALASIPEACDASGATSPVIPGFHFVSITASGVSKATGVAALATLAGCEMSNVMMVGDGQNDVSAMNVVGHPVAMGNAHAEATAASRYQVADVDHDGVAEALDLAISLRTRRKP
jgi:Cof subfamily protein (haloacid dehalogenase superfamily)